MRQTRCFSAPQSTPRKKSKTGSKCGPFPRPPCRTSTPVLALSIGANSPRDFQHGPPAQGANPFQALIQRRGGLALLTGGRVLLAYYNQQLLRKVQGANELGLLWRLPLVGVGELLGGYFFNRNYGEFSTGVDKT